MGCIVNGPGEMADADYGYVGTGPDKITLYKGREVVQRNVPSNNAVDVLITLIKEHGDWVKPIFPSNISCQGSPPTPYIFDDRVQYEDAGGIYHTMRLTESEMDNVVKTKRIYDS